MLGDTARIINLQPNSPAEKAGIMLRDQIISINDSLVAGRGLNLRQVKDYLSMPMAKPPSGDKKKGRGFAVVLRLSKRSFPAWD
jgi:C-terminal processing protease CtpA/Prc